MPTATLTQRYGKSVDIVLDGRVWAFAPGVRTEIPESVARLCRGRKIPLTEVPLFDVQETVKSEAQTVLGPTPMTSAPKKTKKAKKIRGQKKLFDKK